MDARRPVAQEAGRGEGARAVAAFAPVAWRHWVSREIFRKRVGAERSAAARFRAYRGDVRQALSAMSSPPAPRAALLRLGTHGPIQLSCDTGERADACRAKLRLMSALPRVSGRFAPRRRSLRFHQPASHGSSRPSASQRVPHRRPRVKHFLPTYGETVAGERSPSAELVLWDGRVWTRPDAWRLTCLMGGDNVSHRALEEASLVRVSAGRTRWRSKAVPSRSFARCCERVSPKRTLRLYSTSSGPSRAGR